MTFSGNFTSLSAQEMRYFIPSHVVVVSTAVTRPQGSSYLSCVSEIMVSPWFMPGWLGSGSPYSYVVTHCSLQTTLPRTKPGSVTLQPALSRHDHHKLASWEHWPVMCPWFYWILTFPISPDHLGRKARTVTYLRHVAGV